MPEKVVSAAQTALYLMENAHQQTAQERQKKLILKLKPFSEVHGKGTLIHSTNVVRGGVCQAGDCNSRTGESHEKAEHPFREEKSFFRLPPLKLPKQPWGWNQERSYKIPTILQGNRSDSPIQPSRTEQPRSKKLKLLSNQCVNCQKEIINCHHTLNLSVILPSIKRGIVTSLHAGRIKEFIENWGLITQDPWVDITVSPGFSVATSGSTNPVAAVPSTAGSDINREKWRSQTSRKLESSEQVYSR